MTHIMSQYQWQVCDLAIRSISYFMVKYYTLFNSDLASDSRSELVSATSMWTNTDISNLVHGERLRAI